MHNSQERENLVLGDRVSLYEDAAYRSQETLDKLKDLGIEGQVQRKGYRNNPLYELDKIPNAEIAVTRGGERPFATYKKHYHLTRTRFMGLAKTPFFGLAAMAANIRKRALFLTLYGLLECKAE